MGYISQVAIDGGEPVPVASSLYGICPTLANNAAKVVLCPNFDHLVNGVTIHVKFSKKNTAANPTMNVNATGAYPMYRYGATPVGTDEGSSWRDGSVISLTFDGTSWTMNDSSFPVLSDVATSGSYNDLLNKPTIPSKTSDLANDSNFVAGTSLASVAISGSYNDLSNKPTIPSKISDLTNDSDFATHTDISQAFAANDAMVFKGTLGSSGTTTSLPAIHEAGWTYKVVNAGIYAGQLCEVGDMVICIADGTEATSLDWTVAQANVDFLTKANTYNGIYTIYTTNTSSNVWACSRDPSYGYVDVFEQGTTILCYLNNSSFAGGSDVTIDIQGLTFEYGNATFITGAPVYKNGSPFSEACPQGTILLLNVHGPKLEVIAQTKQAESVKLDQGSANAGKLLYVNSNGTVVPASLSVTNETLQII